MVTLLPKHVFLGFGNRFNVKIRKARATSSPFFESELKKRMAGVDWGLLEYAAGQAPESVAREVLTDHVSQLMLKKEAEARFRESIESRGAADYEVVSVDLLSESRRLALAQKQENYRDEKGEFLYYSVKFRYFPTVSQRAALKSVSLPLLTVDPKDFAPWMREALKEYGRRKGEKAEPEPARVGCNDLVWVSSDIGAGGRRCLDLRRAGDELLERLLGKAEGQSAILGPAGKDDGQTRRVMRALGLSPDLAAPVTILRIRKSEPDWGRLLLGSPHYRSDGRFRPVLEDLCRFVERKLFAVNRDVALRVLLRDCLDVSVDWELASGAKRREPGREARESVVVPPDFRPPLLVGSAAAEGRESAGRASRARGAGPGAMGRREVEFEAIERFLAMRWSMGVSVGEAWQCWSRTLLQWALDRSDAGNVGESTITALAARKVFSEKVLDLLKSHCDIRPRAVGVDELMGMPEPWPGVGLDNLARMRRERRSGG